MINKIKHEVIIIIGIITLTILYFRRFFFEGLVPFPGNLLASFYAPWSGEKWPGFPVGVPRLDLLGVDTVRQDFPWKSLVADALKNGNLPLWNPFSFSGHPQLAAFQEGAFYPLNILFLFLSKIDAWTILTILQPLLAFFFTYIFVRNLNIGKFGSFFAGIAFAFSPYLTAWLPWLMAPHAILWLPLVLYSVDKIIKERRARNISLLTFSLTLSLFAGHPQSTIYIFLTAIAYFLFRVLEKKDVKSKIKQSTALFLISIILFLGITSVQWLSTVKLYSQSLREVKSSEFVIGERFLNWEKLATFLAPDFFGNPVTENYWGKGNYIENTIYTGVTALIFLGLAIFFVKERTSKFFLLLIISSFLIALPTPISSVLVSLKIPMFSTSVPTRTLFLAAFSFAVLAGYGIDYWLKTKIPIKKITIIIFLILAGYIVLWSYSLLTHKIVSIRNLILPTGIFLLSVCVLYIGQLRPKFKTLCSFLFIPLFIVDSFYLANKITYFSHRQFTFPSHPVIDFLQKNAGINRFYGEGSAKIDSNFGIVYNLQQAEGYDALYISHYGELITAANNGGKIIKDIPRSTADLPSEKNKYRERLFSLLGIKYIIDKNDLYQKEWEPEYDKFPQDSYDLVWQKGKWKIYDYKKSLPRIFLADNVIVENDKQKIVDKIFNPDFDFKKTVIVEKQPLLELESSAISTPTATLQTYELNKIQLTTKSDQNQALFLSDNFYPGWKAYIDGTVAEIYRANYTFRAVFVPKGEHNVVFSFEPDTVKWGGVVSIISLFMIFLLILFERHRLSRESRELFLDK